VSYLRFSTDEYQTISRLCDALDLSRYPLHTFKRLLLASLADCFPELAQRVAGLGRTKVQLLYQHLRRSPQAERGHGLTDEEVKRFARAGLPLLTQARFVHLLKRALVHRLRGECPSLAAKLERLSLGQFGVLCQEVNQRAVGET
jgi:hypothetical protein